MRAPKRQKVVLVMVGLPARGKTYMARKMARYLRWRGYAAKVFNVGNYRRRLLGEHQDHSFFDPKNRDGMSKRRQMAEVALDDLLCWCKDGGDIAIYDATNSSRKRRAWVRSCCEGAGYQVIFILSVCTDPLLVDANVQETKVSMPDYAGVDPTIAGEDFRARIGHYEDAYEDLLDTDSYIAVYNVGQRVEVNRITGYLPGRLVTFLMNLHLTRRPIWLTRHGESAFNVERRIGGDPPLTERGTAYAGRLAAFIAAKNLPALKVWTSTLQRSMDTAAPIGGHPIRWRALDEIDAGVCDGLTYTEVEVRYPDEYAARMRDKLRYRYPRGESYVDVIHRLEPVITELERQRDPVLVVGHQAVLRSLYAYFVDEELERVPHLEIPLHTVLQLTPQTYGCTVERLPL